MTKNTLHIEITGSTADERLRVQEVLHDLGWETIDGDGNDINNVDGTSTRSFNVEVPQCELTEGGAVELTLHEPEVTIDEEYCEEGVELNDRIFDEIYPILNELDDDYPEHSAYFSMFINLLYSLFYQGWTPKELIEEIKDHHVLYVQDEFADLKPHELQ